MKSNFKILILLILISINSWSRDIVTIRYDKQTNLKTLAILQNALIKQLGIPKQFIKTQKTINGACKKKDRHMVIGLCIENKKVRLFFINRKLYVRSIKKIIDLYQRM